MLLSTRLKKATLEILRSSPAVREDAKMDLNTAGVSGLRFFSSGTGATGKGVDDDAVDCA
jgi:hypothetical protein